MSLWTPSAISTALWLDASDSSTLFDAVTGGSTPTNNGAVARWEDKSGNARHATQSTLARRPIFVTSGQNGLNVVSFTAASTQWLALPNTTNPSGTSGVFAACKPNNTSASAMIIGRAFNWGSWQLVSASTGTITRYGVGRTGVDEGVANSSGLTNNTDKIFSGTYDNSFVRVSANGGAFASTAYTPNPTYNANDSTTVGVFRATDGSVASPFNGPMYEIVVVHSWPSQDTTERIQGYLAWKWGLQTSLPSDHPYRNGAPTTGAQRRVINDGLFNRGLFGRSLVR